MGRLLLAAARQAAGDMDLFWWVVNGLTWAPCRQARNIVALVIGEQDDLLA